MACLRCTGLVLILGIGLWSNGTAAELALQLESQDGQVQLKVYADAPDAAGQTRVSVIVNAKQPGNRTPLNELTEGAISLAFPEQVDILYDKVQVMVWGYSEQDYVAYERDPGWTKGIPALGNYLLGLLPGYSLIAGVDDVVNAFLSEKNLLSPPAAFVDPNAYDVVPLSWKGRMLAPGYRSVKLCYIVRMNDQRLSSVALYGYVKAQERGESGPDFTSEHILQAKSLAQTLDYMTTRKTVYFLAGHGERLIAGGDADSLGAIRQSLEGQRYEVKTLSMVAMKEPKVPDDCAVLVIAGSQQPLPKKEITAIKDYIAQDGNLFIAVDPPPAPDLHEILAEHGVTPLQGVVIDPERCYYDQPRVPIVKPITHEITRDIEGIAFPHTRGFELQASSEAQALLKSSSAAYLETQPDHAYHKGGPLTLAVLIDEGSLRPQTSRGTQMIVVGNSIMMTDRLVRSGNFGGFSLVIESIAWMIRN